MTETTYAERTWTFDRLSDFPPGPWDGEPDKVQWVDETTGLDCLIVRNHVGGLCGYVGVAADHPWFEKDYDDVEPYPHVHGGLTFASRCQPGTGEDRVCHTPYPGRTDEIWWLGFDCVHLGDLSPLDAKLRSELPQYIRDRDDRYRDVGYVKAEVTELAEQASVAARKQ